MRRKLLFLILLVLAALPASAQTLTQVTGTILDPVGLPYSNATIQISLISPGGPSPTLTPCTAPVAVGCSFTIGSPIQTDNSGSFSVALWANASILPAATQYQFTVNEPGAPVPWGTGPQGCSLTTTVAGASQSLSAAFATLPCPALTRAVSLQSKKVNLSSAQILASGTPIQLLPAPGPGLYYMISEVIWQYNFNTVTYSGTNRMIITNPALLAHGNPWGEIPQDLLVGFPQSEVQSWAQGFALGEQGVSKSGQFQLGDLLNQPMQLCSAATPTSTSCGSPPTLGDGTVTMTIYYSVNKQ